jgi:hypothetical protein
MATTYKVLGQSYPSASTLTTLYTVPSSTQTVVSTIGVSNQTGTQLKFRIAVRPAGETISEEHYIVYDSPISGNDSLFITVGATLAETDVLTCYATTSGLSFSAFGSEIV